MGRILGLRRRRGAIPEFEAALARLSDELVLTESFAGVMIRDGNLEAAAAAVDEQRDRLRKAEAAMLATLRPRRRFQVAVAGVAALMMLATGAVAALRAIAPEPAHAAIQRLEQNLEKVGAASTTVQANQIFATALTEFDKINESDLENPEISVPLLQMLNEQIAKLEGSGLSIRSLTDRLRRERVRVRRHIEAEPIPTPSSSRRPPSDNPQPPPEPSPEAPPAPDPVSS